MTIIEKVRAKKAEHKSDQSKAIENRDKAVAAVLAGIRSGAWKTYMEQFADTPDQLRRLLGTDGTLGDANLDLKRAYLVANAVCGAGTVDELDREVNTIDH